MGEKLSSHNLFFLLDVLYVLFKTLISKCVCVCVCVVDATHIPFGRPAVLFQTSYSLLQHSDYIGAYSYELHMPLWTAFTLTPQV